MESSMKLLLSLLVILVSAHCAQCFSQQEAVDGWELVNVAYCPQEIIEDWTCKNCVQSGYNLKYVQAYYYGGSGGYVGYSPTKNAIVVTFRGSENIPNWINNLNFERTAYPYCNGCKVHTGFYKCYLDLVDEFREMVLDIKAVHPTATLQVFGHSLGGSMAVHGAADLYQNLGLKAEFVYTYGQPRVGNPDFERWFHSIFNGRFWRVTHNRDLVPHLPLISMGFEHTPTEVWYNKESSKHTICDGSGEDPKCSNSQLNLDVDDHLTYMDSGCCCELDLGMNHTTYMAQQKAETETETETEKTVLKTSEVASVRHTNTTYNVTLAELGWDIANVMYCDAASIAAWNCTRCNPNRVKLTDVFMLGDGDAEAYGFTGYNPATHTVVLSFAGSADWPSWVASISALQTHFPFCKDRRCEVGVDFYRAYLSIVEDVRNQLHLLIAKYNAQSVNIFGWGLGGALATHAAADLTQKDTKPKDITVYTYGSPRVGNKGFTAWLNDTEIQMFRVTHAADIVQNTPPALAGFHHAALEVYYPQDNLAHHVCDGSGEDPKCAKQELPPYSASDHTMYFGEPWDCSDGSKPQDPIAPMKIPEFAKTESEPATKCSGLTDCGSCLGHKSLGLNDCAWCPYQEACHAVGSVYNPCPDKLCISKSPISQCQKSSCP